MDMNTILKSVMSSDVLSELGKSAGVDEKEAASVLTEVLPSLLKGAQGQQQKAETAESFLGALLEHGDKDSSDMAKFVKNIDVEDGAKIVGHLLGSDKSAAAEKAAAKSGVDSKKILKIMAIAAPIVMNQLGKNAKKNSKKDDKSDLGDVAAALLKNVDAGDVLKIAKMFLK